MKTFIVLFCVCLGALAIPPPKLSPSEKANAIFTQAKNFADQIQQNTLPVIDQNGNLDAFVECTVNDVVEFITSAIATVRRLGYHDLADLATTILKSSQIAYDIFENAGISKITIIAVEIINWINDVINILSIRANKLDNKINVVTVEVINLPALLTQPLSIEQGTKLLASLISLNNASLAILAERNTIEELLTEHEQVVAIYGKRFVNLAKKFIKKVIGKVNPKFAKKKIVDRAVDLIEAAANYLFKAGVVYFDLVEIYLNKNIQALTAIIKALSTNAP